MVILGGDEPLAVAVVEAIHSGDLEALRRLLREHPGLATARLGDDRAGGTSRTPLHVATDWPGHFPNAAATVATLVEAGADVNARFRGGHGERPLHWAASCDDLDAIDALLDLGADIEATGAVIGGGTPLDDAVAFGQWRAAQRLVERGAQTRMWHEAPLGMLDRLEERCTGGDPPTPDETSAAFWHACRRHRRAAEYLLGRGADVNWIPGWEPLTPLDAASREGAEDLVAWLRGRGARAAAEIV